VQKLSGLSVLLVEDAYLIALDAAEILKRLGIKKVVLGATFEAAEKLAAEAEFQAAVLDVNINGRFSFPIANTIAQRGIPVVYATGYELRDRPAFGLNDAVCVTNPYTTDRLKEACPPRWPKPRHTSRRRPLSRSSRSAVAIGLGATQRAGWRGCAGNAPQLLYHLVGDTWLRLRFQVAAGFATAPTHHLQGIPHEFSARRQEAGR